MTSDLDIIAGTAELAAPAPGSDHPHVPVPSPSRWRDVFRQILHSWSGRIGLVLATLIIAMAVFAPLIAPFGPDEVLLDSATNEVRLERPCVHVLGCDESEVQHLMGLDENGRDEFSRLVFGARISLLAGAAAVVLAVVVGTIIGLVAGFFGGRLDNVLMRCMDVLLSFPSLLLAILIVTVLGRGLINSVLAIAIVSVPAYARVVRGQVLSVREQDFITADRALGVRSGRLLVAPRVPQHADAADRPGDARLRHRRLGDRRPRVPRPRCAAARCRVGHDDLGGVSQHLQLAAPRVLAWAVDLPQRAGVQPPRRCPPRCPRPAKRAAMSEHIEHHAGIDDDALGPAAEVTATVSEAPPETAPPLLEVSDLRTWFHTRAGEVHAVDGVDLTVRKGEVLGLVGESGSGKSVTMLSVMRLVDKPGRIVSGTVTFDGIDVLALPRNAMRSLRGDRISMIFQQPNASLHPCFTAGVQISEVYEIHRNARARRRPREGRRDAAHGRHPRRQSGAPSRTRTSSRAVRRSG